MAQLITLADLTNFRKISVSGMLATATIRRSGTNEYGIEAGTMDVVDTEVPADVTDMGGAGSPDQMTFSINVDVSTEAIYKIFLGYKSGGTVLPNVERGDEIQVGTSLYRVLDVAPLQTLQTELACAVQYIGEAE